MPGRDSGEQLTRFFVDQGPVNQRETTGGGGVEIMGLEWATSQECRDLDSLQVKGKKKMDSRSSSKGQQPGCQGVEGAGPEE